MSKELTPLEVSKLLKDFVLEFVKNGLDRRFIHGSFDIIETALKRLEQIETNQIIFENNPITVGKKIMALEIIKEKGLDIREFRYCSSLYEYNICKNIGCKELTQEEYELLKEVLL